MKTINRVSLLGSVALLALGACSDFDMDLRRTDSGFSTSEAARQATAARPRADARGVITYPDYQVVIARGGDSVSDVADRIGISARELASFNALTPETGLRAGEVLALPRMLSGTAPGRDDSGEIEISTLADSAIARAEGRAPAAPPTQVQPASQQPTRHRVERGETAFQIARLYNVTPRALAEWNGLDPEMRVREGQMLMIPVARDVAAAAPAPEPERVPEPGTGSATPTPPSASAPLPEPAPPAQESAAAAEEARPPSPALSETRTEASRAQFVMPVDGRVIAVYNPSRNMHGIRIAATAGTEIKSAGPGTVLRVHRDDTGRTILLIRHADNITTAYLNVDRLTVQQDDRVTAGQKVGILSSTGDNFMHFEVRRGVESVDPMRYLQ